MNPVSIVTIKDKLPLYKKEEKAHSIELVRLEENNFEIVSRKDLYKVGEKVVFIQPDYCLSDIPLFESYIRPGGEKKRSRLGSNNRVRAIKFNFHRGDNNVVYSEGVLIPFKELSDYLVCENIFWWGKDFSKYEERITEVLNITKWEEPLGESNMISGTSSKFPEGLYKTDETNIKNLGIELSALSWPLTLIGTRKCDGSSISIGSRGNCYFICSRNQRINLTHNKVIGNRKLNFLEKILYFFFPKIKPDLTIYEEIESDSNFVKVGKPYLEMLEDWELTNYVLRGEALGTKFKGSGNKNNPDSKLEPHVRLFGIDIFINGEAIPLDDYTYRKMVKEYNFPTCETIFKKEFNDSEELIEWCNNYFKENMIEGIVVRNLDTTFSAKVMNPEYDSKK